MQPNDLERTKRIRTVDELYADRTLYSSPHMFSPPSERLSHVIRFELTYGCSWSRCTYCGGYDGTTHQIRSINDYKNHVDEVWNRIGNQENSQVARYLKRIFIGGGNALEVETDELKEAITYTEKKFTENTGKHPTRISLYGRTGDFLKHGKKGLRKLYYTDSLFGLLDIPHGMDLVYWGIETGSADILAYIDKGCTLEDMEKAAAEINNTRIKTSVMIMPGLGGEKFYDQHIIYTSALLGKVMPDFITFMGINTSVKSRYWKKMKQEMEEGKNRPLLDSEMATQMIEIIDRMPQFPTKIGCYDKNIDAVGHNPLTFNSFQITDYDDKEGFVTMLKELTWKRYRRY